MVEVAVPASCSEGSMVETLILLFASKKDGMTALTTEITTNKKRAKINLPREFSNYSPTINGLFLISRKNIPYIILIILLTSITRQS